MDKEKRSLTCQDCAYFKYRKRKEVKVGYCAAAGKAVNPHMVICQFRQARYDRE